MDGKNFFEGLYNDGDCLEDTEVPLDALLRITLELGERRGRILAMKDYAKANGENLDARELLAIAGIRLEEELNAQM